MVPWVTAVQSDGRPVSHFTDTQDGSFLNKLLHIQQFINIEEWKMYKILPIPCIYHSRPSQYQLNRQTIDKQTWLFVLLAPITGTYRYQAWPINKLLKVQTTIQNYKHNIYLLYKRRYYHWITPIPCCCSPTDFKYSFTFSQKSRPSMLSNAISMS